MRANKVLEIAWKGLTRNKLRSLLTMLGVIIGVAAVIVMISVSAGTEATIAEQINSLGANLLFVSQSMGRGGPGRGSDTPSLVFEDVNAIGEGVSGVIGVSSDRPTVQTVKVGNIVLEEVTLIGTTPDYPEVREIEIDEGRFFNLKEVDRKNKVVVLGYDIAQTLFGDEDPIGQAVAVGTTKLTVIGVMAEKGMVSGMDMDAIMFTPISVVFQKFTPSQFARFIGDRVGTIYVKVDPEADLDSVILQIQLLLAKRKDMLVEELPITIQTQQDIITTREATTEAFRNLLAWVAAVSLIVGGIGIMNIMLVSVTERTREIGIRQSVGATPSDIRWQFLTEALVLSLIGGLIGVLAGVGGAWLFGALGEMRTVVVPGSILLAFTSAAAVGIFFGYYPANAASQLDPIEALRRE